MGLGFINKIPIKQSQLIGYWKMDEINSGTTPDEINGNNGVVNNATLTTGIDLNAIETTGGDSSISILNIDINEENLNLIFYVKVPSGQSYGKSIISKWDVINSDRVFYLFIDGDKLGIELSSDGTYSTSTAKDCKTNGVIADNQWHLVNFNFKNNDIKVSFDGVEQVLTYSFYNADIYQLHNASNPIIIGGINEGSDRNLQLTIDDLKIL